MPSPMKLNPTITVVIPVYNRAKIIVNAIESVLSQSHSVHEIIVVDDGSTDEIQSIVEKLNTNSKIPIRLIRQANSGPSNARNRGVFAANSLFVLLLDSDDRLLPDAIYHLCTALKSHDVDMVIGSRITILPSKKKRLTITKALDKNNFKNFEDELLSKRPTVGIGAAVIRKSFFIENPFPEHIRICEDLVFYASAFLKGNCIAIQKPIVEIDQTRHHEFQDPSLLLVEHQNAYTYAIMQMVNGPQKKRLQKKLAPYPALRTFRELHRAGFNNLALRYYLQAFRIDPLASLQVSYLRKFLRTILRIRHPASFKQLP
jgi:glycosyltransferase involved in cell wall biosynthesis